MLRRARRPRRRSRAPGRSASSVPHQLLLQELVDLDRAIERRDRRVAFLDRRRLRSVLARLALAVEQRRAGLVDLALHGIEIGHEEALALALREALRDRPHRFLELALA